MNIGIIGLGLIGGSLGRCILKKTNHKVFGLDIKKEVEDAAVAINAINDKITEENVSEIDILFLGVYPSSCEEYIKKYCDRLKDGAIIVDLCGNKRTVIKIMEKYSKKYPNINFLGGHPMAGREFIGIRHSSAKLFDRAYFICINVNADIQVLADFKKFILSLGFLDLVITTAKRHDEIIAYTSQLAHIVSSSYIKSETVNEYLGFSAGSFRDMTRVARLSPSMWTELMLENKDNLIKEIDTIICNLSEYRDTLKNSDSEKMKMLLKEGNDKKLEIEHMRTRKKK